MDGQRHNERRAAMRAANPAFIPRNHLVEEAISAAVNDGYFPPFESLLTVLSMPYEDQPAFGRYVDPPRPDQVVHQTPSRRPIVEGARIGKQAAYTGVGVGAGGRVAQPAEDQGEIGAVAGHALEEVLC